LEIRKRARNLMAINEKQERFAQAYILHRNATEAARAAGYTGSSAQAFANQGHRLLNNEEIKERIEELESTLETNVDVISEIEAQYNNANRSGNATSAIKALELLSKVRGVKNDKEVELTPETVDLSIVKSLKILGKDKVNKLIELCEFK